MTISIKLKYCCLTAPRINNGERLDPIEFLFRTAEINVDDNWMKYRGTTEYDSLELKISSSGERYIQAQLIRGIGFETFQLAHYAVFEYEKSQENEDE